MKTNIEMTHKQYSDILSALIVAREEMRGRLELKHDWLTKERLGIVTDALAEVLPEKVSWKHTEEIKWKNVL